MRTVALINLALVAGGPLGRCAPSATEASRVALITLDPMSALRLAVIALWVETGALAVLVVFLVYKDLTGSPTSARGAALVTLYPAAFGALLGLLAWSLYRRRRWARGPAIVLQLLLLPLGYAMATGGAPLFGVPIMIVGLVGAGALLAPGTRHILGVE